MKPSNRTTLFSMLIVVISFFVVIDSIRQWQQTEAQAIVDTKANVKQNANDAVKEIRNHLNYVMDIGNQLSEQLTTGQLRYNQAEHHLLQLAIKNHQHGNLISQPQFYSIRIAFDKGIYNSSQPNDLTSWSFYYDKKTAQLMENKNEGYDYTQKSSDDHDTSWFTDAVKQRKAFWQEPRYGNVSKDFLIACSIPFFTDKSKQKIAGVITINLSIDGIKDILYAQNYRATGYSMVLSPKGRLIYHPDRLITLAGATDNFKIYYPNAYNFIQIIQRDYAQNPDQIRSYTLPNSGKQAWVVFKKIPEPNWDFYIIFYESELHIDEKNIGANLRLTISAVFFLISLTAVFLIKDIHNIRRLWYFSILTTIIFCAGIGRVWVLADIKEITLPKDASKLNSTEDVINYQKNKNAFFKSIYQPRPIYIPTGVFIKSTEFQGANNISISGYIWQKYRLPPEATKDSIPENFCDYVSDAIPKDKGVILFEASESKIDLSCKDATYTSISDGSITIGWYFMTLLREPFDYANYPLDKNLIWLRLRPNSFSQRIILIPDFRAYPFIFETAYAGLDRNNLVLPNWGVLATFFTHQQFRLNSNMGINGYVGQTSEELLFNIMIKRNFLDAFTSTVIPICIIYLILFVVLFSGLIDLLAVLGINAGLLFSVALWHSGLRESLASTGVTYFETFYFLCYFVISLVCINSVLLSSQFKFKLLTYEDNLLPKLIFFPLVTGMTFVIALWLLFAYS